MPQKKKLVSLVALTAALLAARGVHAADENAQAIYDRVTPSLVAVKYTYVGEIARQDLIIPGIVVSDSGLVMIPLQAVNELIPDEQMKSFKIIIPKTDVDNVEVDAEFQGRDERAEVAFIKASPIKPGTQPSTAPAEAPVTWTPLKFEQKSPKIGDSIYSIGMLPKSGGYHTFLTKSVVASYLRGPVKQVMATGGGLGPAMSPVFDTDGAAIGFVGLTPPASFFLNDEMENQQTRMIGELVTNRYYIPTSEFAIGLADPPSADHPVPLAWSGLPELTGLSKNDAALFGLENKPAIQINDIMPDSPAEKAGLKKRDVIIKINGQPLERGDLPEELPAIMHRKLIMFKPGDVVTFTVTTGKDQPTRDVKVTLEPQPKRANVAQRYYTDEIGFGVREMVMLDRYGLKLKKSEKDGVLVTVLKEGGSAANAGLRPNDMITQVNGQPITNLDEFKTTYEDFRKTHEHDAIVMLVHRGNSDETIRIEPPQ